MQTPYEIEFLHSSSLRFYSSFSSPLLIEKRGVHGTLNVIEPVLPLYHSLSRQSSWKAFAGSRSKLHDLELNISSAARWLGMTLPERRLLCSSLTSFTTAAKPFDRYQFMRMGGPS